MAVRNGKANSTSVETQVESSKSSENERKAALVKFADSVYNKPLSKAPIAQILNGQEPEKIGLFIKENILDAIDWKGEIPTHTHVFSSGVEERGVLLQSPRINVIQVSQRFIELRDDDEEGGIKAGTLLNMVFESNEGYEFYMANKEKYVLRRFYFVFVLDENNQNLHQVPIAISLKGVASTKLGMALEEFQSSLETAFANYNCTNRSSKKEEFHRLGVFHPTFAPSHEPKTEPNAKKRSWVAIVESFTTPNPDGSDFLNFFCEWKEAEYNELVATNPDLAMSIGKLSPIIQEHNRLVSGGIRYLPPAIDMVNGELEEPPY
ncbi:MAG: hypothetical protein HC815_05845 [Richelia sp. RM1_1_1]|nr:hypothetical protein [Richelia sp. RM1_1_1]